jgi:hypothetical protein
MAEMGSSRLCPRIVSRAGLFSLSLNGDGALIREYVVRFPVFAPKSRLHGPENIGCYSSANGRLWRDAKISTLPRSPRASLAPRRGAL